MPYKDKEKQKANRRAYYLAHQMELAVYRRAYYQAHKEKSYERGKIWRKTNKQYAQEKDHSSYLVRKRQVRNQTFEAYGGAFCACCGEGHIEFLTLDHINGGGAAERRRIGKRAMYFYGWLRKQGYPPGYRVLCMNCNFALGASGYCPHGTLVNVAITPLP